MRSKKCSPPILFPSNLDELGNLSLKKWGGHIHPSPSRGAAPDVNHYKSTRAEDVRV